MASGERRCGKRQNDGSPAFAAGSPRPSLRARSPPGRHHPSCQRLPGIDRDDPPKKTKKVLRRTHPSGH
jgi:hypothetical protein